MAKTFDKLNKALETPFEVPVYYFASTEEVLLREAAALCVAALEAAGEVDVTRIDGPSPDLGEVIAAAGAISFFGTPRVVELRAISPASMSDKDAKELAELFAELENAVLVVTALYKDKRTATSKKAKGLLEAAGAAGFATELQKPGRAENLAYIRERAEALGASFQPGAAEMLLERAGDDRPLLAAEVAKLAAVCGYKTIPQKAVAYMSVPNIEADVFDLAKHICAGRRAETFEKLNDLLALKHEPIAISAALAGTYTDMLRMGSAKQAKKPMAQVMKDMGYKGSDWRLKKAAENASRYSPAALDACVLCLAKLDQSLKSSAVTDKSVLLQAAVGELVALREAGR